MASRNLEQKFNVKVLVTTRRGGREWRRQERRKGRKDQTYKSKCRPLTQKPWEKSSITLAFTWYISSFGFARSKFEAYFLLEALPTIRWIVIRLQRAPNHQGGVLNFSFLSTFALIYTKRHQGGGIALLITQNYSHLKKRQIAKHHLLNFRGLGTWNKPRLHVRMFHWIFRNICC